MDVLILQAFPVNAAGPELVVAEPEANPGASVEVVVGLLPPVMPITLKIYDPRANVVTSLSVSSPEGPEVVSTIVVVYDPPLDETG
jgi:hypothetical protein